MGGDYGPPVTIPAALAVLAKYPNLSLVLVGDTNVLNLALAKARYDHKRLSVVHASQQVEMDEQPSLALRNKKDSSMRVAINLVKEKNADACVSAGNTGALMATARFVLKTLPGIDRPAIISSFPTIDPDKNMRMLDLGANVDTNVEHLVQFAVMGSVLAKAVDNISQPKIFLLNIGEEDIKGNELVKQTAKRLADLSCIHFAGYLEADALHSGVADVIVCDGFVGNVALKTTEGAANFITGLIKEAFLRNRWSQFVGLLAKPILKTFSQRIDPAVYNGATFIGLQGTVIKSHGGASVRAFMHAIEEAIHVAEKNIPERIRHEVENLLQSSP